MKHLQKIDWEYFANLFKSSLVHFPVELLLGLLCSVAMVFQNSLNAETNFIYQYQIFGLVIATAFLCNQLFTSPKNRFIYYLLLPIGIVLQFFNIDLFIHSNAYTASWVIVILGNAIAKHTNSTQAFASNILYLIIDLFFTFIITIALFFIFEALFFSTTYIFHLSAWNNASATVTNNALFIIYPFIALFLFFVLYQRRYENRIIENNFFLDIFLNYILTPAIIIYTALLYLYTLAIILHTEMPEGKITLLVFSFICITLVAQALQPLIKRHPFQWYYRNFSYFAIVPMLLFWYAFIYRIGAYGLTDMRIYLLITAIWLTFIIVILKLKPQFNYRFLLLFGIIILAIFSYIPGISAHHLAIVSQRHELNQLIEQTAHTTPEGKIVSLNYTPQNADAYFRILNTYEYLDKNGQQAWLINRYGYSLVQLDSTFYAQKESILGQDKPVYYYTRFQKLNIPKASTMIIDPDCNLDDNNQTLHITFNYNDTININPLDHIKLSCIKSTVNNGFVDPKCLTVQLNDTIIYIQSININNKKINSISIPYIVLPR